MGAGEAGMRPGDCAHPASGAVRAGSSREDRFF